MRRSYSDLFTQLLHHDPTTLLRPAMILPLLGHRFERDIMVAKVDPLDGFKRRVLQESP